MPIIILSPIYDFFACSSGHICLALIVLLHAVPHATCSLVAAAAGLRRLALFFPSARAAKGWDGERVTRTCIRPPPHASHHPPVLCLLPAVAARRPPASPQWSPRHRGSRSERTRRRSQIDRPPRLPPLALALTPLLVLQRAAPLRSFPSTLCRRPPCHPRVPRSQSGQSVIFEAPSVLLLHGALSQPSRTGSLDAAARCSDHSHHSHPARTTTVSVTHNHEHALAQWCRPQGSSVRVSSRGV